VGSPSARGNQSGKRQFRCGSVEERRARGQGYHLIAGLDEAGRGCLFGDVYAAAVILPDRSIPRGLNDSKQLTAEQREALAPLIRERALAWSVATATAAEVDAINIYQASRLAMKRALEALAHRPDYLLVDALRLDTLIPQRALIHGDAISVTIAAASILAKTARDEAMLEWDRIYPHYGLARHKGYGTAAHLRALAEFGPTPHHRTTYEPVRRLCPAPAAASQHRQEVMW
jgi:ribonuclease HII